VDRGQEPVYLLRSRAQPQRRTAVVESEDRARQAREVRLDGMGDGPQRLVERNTARDLLEDVGLVHREQGGPPLFGDVVTDRLELDDRTTRIEERAIGPAIPPAHAIGAEFPVVVDLDLRAGTEAREARAFLLALGRWVEIEQQRTDEISRRTAVEV